MLPASDAGGDIQAYRDALPAVNKTIPEFLLEVGTDTSKHPTLAVPPRTQ